MKVIKAVCRFYRANGLFASLALAWTYLGELVRLRLHRVDVLFISGCPGGSRKYRCENLAEVLQEHGVRSLVVSQSNPFIRRFPSSYRIYVLQRVFVDARLGSLFERISRSNQPVMFETDDLVFDPKYLQYIDFLRSLPEAERRRYSHGIGKELLTDSVVEVCTVSTRFLAQALTDDYPDKRVFVLRNRLARDQLDAAERALKARHTLRASDGKVRIGYSSGSPSHDRDFALIADVLLDLLRAHPGVVLMIVGYLSIDARFAELEGQIERCPFVDLRALPSLLVRCDINIAPLEIDNPFCRAKSELKYFEAGILEVPTVASSTEAFQEAIRHGENGLLAADLDQWREGLERLIADPGLRATLGRQARRDTLTRYTTASDDPEMDAFVEFLRQKMAAGAETAEARPVLVGRTDRR